MLRKTLVDGKVEVEFSESRDRLSILIHTITAMQSRAGLGRAAMKELRQEYSTIEVHCIQDSSVAFWQAMLSEGLIDSGRLMNGAQLTC